MNKIICAVLATCCLCSGSWADTVKVKVSDINSQINTAYKALSDYKIMMESKGFGGPGGPGHHDGPFNPGGPGGPGGHHDGPFNPGGNQGGPFNPGGNHGGPGGIPSGATCSYTDTGWEEHWGGHSSCQDCLSKHGSCQWSCSVSRYQCTAVGTVGRGVSSESKTVSVDAGSYSKMTGDMNEIIKRMKDGSASSDDMNSMRDIVGKLTMLTMQPGTDTDDAADNSSRQPTQAVFTGDYFERYYDAQQSALRRCQMSGARNCSYQNCNSSSQPAGSGMCH